MTENNLTRPEPKTKKAERSGYGPFGVLIFLVSIIALGFIFLTGPEAILLDSAGDIGAMSIAGSGFALTLLWGIKFAKMGLIVGPIFMIGGSILNAIRSV